jgi:curved DNA-binding protein CbpA
MKRHEREVIAVSADPDAYATLHVAPDTPAEVISALYRALARRLHPDGPTPDLPRMTEVNRAYHLIKTPELRRQYDAARTVVAMGPGPAVSPAPAGAPAHRPASPTQPLRSQLASREPWATFLDSGPYAGWRISEVARVDPEYLRWLSRHTSGVPYRREIARCLPDERGVGSRTASRG